MGMKPSFGVVALVSAILSLAPFAKSAPLTGGPHDNDPDVLEIRQYRLTMDKVEKAAAATEQVSALMASKPDLKKKADAENDDDATIDQKAKRFDTQFPEATAIIHKNGLSTREYIVVSLALFNDMMMVGMKMQGAIKEYPPNSVTPENAAFIEQNFDRLKALSRKMTAHDGDQEN
jgi:hypothetical protein